MIKKIVRFFKLLFSDIPSENKFVDPEILIKKLETGEAIPKRTKETNNLMLWRIAQRCSGGQYHKVITEKDLKKFKDETINHKLS
ncbi:MAG TPA: hypothetical protein P5052_00545 [Candidatus Paceibacterota bacterium]|jgi:hypothetical protein|nr:hypothetical protein [Candidatus Paceibacterota bacterium]HRZ29290.1 hypothetical protein [Candidatus Paceibacterota bacterium]